MPQAVCLVASDDAKQNLSDEAYAAFQEPGTIVTVSAFSGQPKARVGQRNATVIMEQVRESEMPDEPVLILKPHLRTRPGKRPKDVTVKERLSAPEIHEMLRGPRGWKLAVPNGTSTDVLTQDMLKEAWETEASGTVTRSLRGADNDEQAVLDEAKETVTPKAGAARISAAIGAPVTNAALLAAALGGFLGWKGDEVARTYLLYTAVACALASITLSLIGNLALRKSPISLSRLDLLQQRSGSFGPPTWLANLCVALFVVALFTAVFSVFPKKSSGAPSASFGQLTTSQAGALTKISFSLTWKNLDSDATKVKTTVTSGSLQKVVTTPKRSDETVSQTISLAVRTPTTLTVSSEAIDAKGQPIGDEIRHTYKVP